MLKKTQAYNLSFWPTANPLFSPPKGVNLFYALFSKGGLIRGGGGAYLIPNEIHYLYKKEEETD